MELRLIFLINLIKWHKKHKFMARISMSTRSKLLPHEVKRVPELVGQHVTCIDNLGALVPAFTHGSHHAQP
jgi:hypothetical protein